MEIKVTHLLTISALMETMYKELKMIEITGNGPNYLLMQQIFLISFSDLSQRHYLHHDVLQKECIKGL